MTRRHHEAMWPAYIVDPLTSTTIGDVALDSRDDHQDLVDRYGAIPETLRYDRSGTVLSAEVHSLWFLSKARLVTYMIYRVMNKYWDRFIVALVLTPHNGEQRDYRRIGLLFINFESAFSTDNFSRDTVGQQTTEM
jgi:hypothetical protein